MTSKLTRFLAVFGVLGGISAATPLFAQETKPPQPRQTEGTMGDHRGMTDMMREMSPDQMKQMAKMMENCNRMMENMGNASDRGGKSQTPSNP